MASVGGESGMALGTNNLEDTVYKRIPSKR
jgi:hypothetical protein